MNSIEDTAQHFEVSQTIKRKLQTALSTTQSLYQLFNFFRQPSLDSAGQTVISNSNNLPELNFSGQHTDIAFCGTSSSGISIDTINNIKDPNIRENVMLSYNKACTEGFLYFDNQYYTLTDKGKDLINTSSFIEQFEKDQKNSLIDNQPENSVSIKLNGNGDDLNVFQYVDNINLNKLAYNDPEKYKQVVSYFEKCEKYDFVKINDGIVTPTEKTTNMLKRNQSFSLDNIEKVSSKNIDKIINIDDYRKTIGLNSSAVKTTAESITTASKTTSDMTGKVATEIAKETAKTTAKAGKTVAKAGATASTGIASAGISTGVQAVVELSKAGVKNFNKAMTLNQNKKVKLSNQK